MTILPDVKTWTPDHNTVVVTCDRPDGLSVSITVTGPDRSLADLLDMANEGLETIQELQIPPTPQRHPPR